MELIFSFVGIIVFSLYDYFGFHVSYKKGWEDFTPVNRYRISQSIVQVIITFFLFCLYGWFSAFAFNVLWWTWWPDFLFYFWYDFLKIYGYPRKPGGFREQVLGNKVTWAYWTAWGLMSRKKNGDVISSKALFVQAGFGLLFVVAGYLILFGVVSVD